MSSSSKGIISVAVIAENIGGGSKEAAPIVRAMMDDYFKYQAEPTPTEQEIDEYVRQVKQSFAEENQEVKK